MAYKTLIAWTDHTFNPWMGCHKVSDGCKHCYAETLVKNRMGKGEMWGANGVRQRTKGPWKKVPGWNGEAMGERKPHRVFCASLADVFEDYPGPNEWRADVFDLIRENKWLDFQLLTKRPENIARMLPDDWDTAFPGFDFYPNVWLGTSIEDNRVADRGPILTEVPAQVHFVSYEPAVGPLDELELDGIEWMIVGGESGPGHRTMDLDWARDMRDRCAERAYCVNCGVSSERPEDGGGYECEYTHRWKPNPVAFFFKQNSAPRTEMGIDALGKVIREYPKGWDRGRTARRLLPEDSFAQAAMPMGD